MSIERHYSSSRVRKSVAHFLGGKAGSAALNFAAFVLVARVLNTTDYGYYVSALAIVELALAFSSLGIDWVAARYIPEFRTRAPAPALRTFILRLAVLQCGILFVTAAALALFSQRAAAALNIPEAGNAVLIYAGYLAIEGSGRLLRDQMLSGLMQQGRAQIIMITRNAIWVFGLLWLLDSGSAAGVVAVATVELAAATVALVGGIAALLSSLRNDASSGDATWAHPAREDMFHLARSAYASYLLSLGYGTQLLTLVLTRFAGVEVAATFGFARNLADQVRKYLPTDLLLSIVRPALIARYTAGRDFATFSGNVGSFFQIGCIALVPLVLIAMVFGSLLGDVLGHGKYADSWIFLALLFAGLLPFSHRKVVELLANSVACAHVCVRANLVLIVIPVAIAAALHLGAPAWSAVAIMIGAEILFNALVIRGLRVRGFRYRFPWVFMMKIVLAIGVSFPILAALPLPENPLAALVAAACLAAVTGLSLLWLLRPLDDETRNLIRRMIFAH